MKVTPTNCTLDNCAFNPLSPPEDSQECIGCGHLTDENWQPSWRKKEAAINHTQDKKQKLYDVTNRDTGLKFYAISDNAQDACKQAGWLVGDCFVVEQKPRRKPVPDHETLLLVKIRCQTCPYQYAVCAKTDEVDCPVRPSTPELQDWLKQTAEAHLCPHIGQSLTKTDYNLGQKWVRMEQAIEELSAKL